MFYVMNQRTNFVSPSWSVPSGGTLKRNGCPLQVSRQAAVLLEVITLFRNSYLKSLPMWKVKSLPLKVFINSTIPFISPFFMFLNDCCVPMTQNFLWISSRKRIEPMFGPCPVVTQSFILLFQCEPGTSYTNEDTYVPPRVLILYLLIHIYMWWALSF